MTQEDLAARTDLHQTYLSGIETGKRNPTVSVLDRLATALGVDVAELLKRR